MLINYSKALDTLEDPLLEGTPWKNEAKDSLADSPLKINFL